MKSVVVLEKRLLGFEAVYGEWIDRSAKHAKLALDAGVEERKVRIADQQRRAHRPGHPLSPRRPRAEQEAADRRSGDCAPPSAGAGRVTLTRLILSWALLVSASLGMAWSWYLRRRNCISEKSMVGLTLLLSWLALVYSAVTTIFVS